MANNSCEYCRDEYEFYIHEVEYALNDMIRYCPHCGRKLDRSHIKDMSRSSRIKNV